MIQDYNRLPLGKYIEICDICADSEASELEKQVAILSCLLDISQDDVLNLPLAEYKEMSAKLKFLEGLPRVQGRRMGRTYKIGGMTFAPVAAIGKMTTAQYIDFQTYSADALHNLPQLCSIFLIPEGHKYNMGYDILEVQELFRTTLSVADANEMIAFFLQRFASSIKGILLYSRWQARRMRNKEERTKMMARIRMAEMGLQQSGDGLRMLMQLQRPSDALGMQSGK